MPVIEKDYQGGALKTTRVSMPGMRGIEAVTTITEPTDSNSSATVDTNWLWYDGHGNCVRSENPITGLSYWLWRDAWGNNDPLTNTAANVKDKGYCANLGHIEDESGLTYMRARYYDPGTGRFVSEDPELNGNNLYQYSDDSPTNKIDFTGKYVHLLIAALAGFIFGALSAAHTPHGNWLLGGVIGAVSAFAGALFMNPIAGGAVGGFLESVLSDLAAGKPINAKKAMFAAAIGGGIGGIAAKAIAAAFVGQTNIAQMFVGSEVETGAESMEKQATAALAACGGVFGSGATNVITSK